MLKPNMRTSKMNKKVSLNQIKGEKVSTADGDKGLYESQFRETNSSYWARRISMNQQVATNSQKRLFDQQYQVPSTKGEKRINVQNQRSTSD